MGFFIWGKNMMSIHGRVLFVLLLSLAGARALSAFPLDGYDSTGIPRLRGYYYSLRTKSGSENILDGARLSEKDVLLSLRHDHFQLPKKDPVFQRELERILRPYGPGASLAVLDISDPREPIYGAVREHQQYNPGSLGKILIAAAFFQSLRDVYPGDLKARRHVLRSKEVSADDFIIKDTHEVPFWSEESGRLSFRPLELGDRATLWMYLDYMLSASSNAAASIVLRELLVLDSLKKHYVYADEFERERVLSRPKGELRSQFLNLMRSTVRRLNLNPDEFLQGGFFTRVGKAKVPGTTSRMTVESVVRFFLAMEQGKLVDEFSSSEIKKLLYATQARIRYAEEPILDRAAVYFKSGSLYSCIPERGFACEKYGGNRINLLHSAGEIEDSARNPRAHYIFALSTNILRKDSVKIHREVARKLTSLMRTINRSVNVERVGWGAWRRLLRPTTLEPKVAASEGGRLVKEE